MRSLTSPAVPQQETSQESAVSICRTLSQRYHLTISQGTSRIAGILMCVLLVALEAACGGGSGAMQDVPPPAPTFTQIDVPGEGTASGEGTFGLGINASGEVVGYYIDANGVVHGFIRSASGTITTVDAPGAGTALDLGTNVRAVNTSGEVTGYYADSNDFLHSYIESSAGTLTEFDPPNSIGSDAFCINDNGDVAGGLLDANGSHGFVRTADGNFSIIDPTGNASQVKAVFPNQINASGDIAGYYTDTNGVFHGFLRDSNGTITTFDAPGAGTATGEGTEISDMNASGVIVGGINVGIVNGVNTTHSFVRATDGTYTVFDPPQSGAHSSFAEGINDSGAVVGTYRDANLVRHGYLLQPDGTFVSFDDPNAAQLPLSTTNLGTTPYRINAGGAIAGLFTDSSGVRHGFVRQ
jgi:hypothetical protein